MAKKALGVEIKNFLKDGFPEGFVHEFDESGDSDLELEEILVDNEFYDLSDDMFGYLVSELDDTEKTFSKAFSIWQRKRNVSYLLVEVPKELLSEAKSKITELGYKVKG